MAEVVSISSHPVDLSDGRVLAPGETAEDVDTDHPHQRALVLDGHLRVLEGTTPRKRASEERAAKAAAKDAKENEEE